MKKIILSILCIISISSLFSMEGQNLPGGCRRPDKGYLIFDELLKSVIAPHCQELCLKNIQSNHPIMAFETGFPGHLGDTIFHEGKYFGGQILTYLGKNPNSEREIGEQVIYLSDETYLTSTDWHLETVAGVIYVMHKYEGFKVFTNHEIQYVISSK